jgi:hypothetical protein
MRQQAFTGRSISIPFFGPVPAIVACICGIAASAGAQAPINPPRAQQSGQFGFSTAAVPDVNGNGRWDFVIGAQNESHGGTPNGGRVHVYNGRTGGRLYTIGPPVRQMLGSFGWSVSGISDVTGDRRGDIIIGAPWEAAGNGTITGRAYLYSGADGRMVRAWASPWGNEMGGFGWATTAVPDVNGDGVPDVVIGAPFETHPGRGTNSGRVYIFCGRTGVFVRALLSPLGQAHGGFGLAVAGIQDLDGDGRGEVIVSAPHEGGRNGPAGAGRVYIFSGATGRLLRVMGSPNAQENGRYGFSLAVGDLNNDGRQDIVVGAPWETPSGLPADSGRAYVYDGATGRGMRHLISPAPRRQGNFGISTTVINDINGDGRNDLIVGADSDAPINVAAGAGLVYGFSSANWSVIRVFRSRNSQLNGRFGASVAALPDIVGNGRGELVVGAPQEDSTGGEAGNSGTVYLFR